MQKSAESYLEKKSEKPFCGIESQLLLIFAVDAVMDVFIRNADSLKIVLQYVLALS